jgi:RNA polymerase sigma-70 factor (ECF subfamily)
MDEATFGAIYESTYGRIFSYCYGRARSRSDAEDYTSETFERAYFRRESLRDLDRAPSWLLTIARNVVVSHWRRKRELSLEAVEERLRARESDDTAERLLHGDERDEPERVAVMNERISEVNRAIRRMPQKEREIFYLKAVVGMSNREAARAVGCSETNVRVTSWRAHKRLRAVKEAV